MTAPLSSIVSVSIAAGTANPTRQGFNRALIISYTATWSERTRTYASIAEVLVDFAVTTPEYKAAAKMFSQNPAPATIKIGRLNGAKPTQTWTILPVVPAASVARIFAGNIDGYAFTITYTDASPTVAEITAALKIAIDIVIAAHTIGVTCTDNGAAGIVIAATAAGVWHSVGTTVDGSPCNDPNLGVVQDHDEPSAGITATELSAILAADADWYGLITTMNSKKVIDLVAAWAESNKRLYVAQTQDSICINTALSGTNDVMESTQAAALEHTSVAYSEDTADFMDAAWVGNRLLDLPGSNTWMFASLATVTHGKYSSTQRSNIRAKNGNFYEDIAGVAIAQDGKIAKGGYIDFTIYKDYLTARLGERIFTALVNARKTPYDDGGIAIIGAEITAQLQTDADRGALLKGTWYVTLPKSSSIPVGGTDRLARILNGVKFYAEYDDAIQTVAITGVLVP